MTETTASTFVGLTNALHARTFTSVKTTGRVEWSSGALRHVVSTLAGTPVMITLDAETGFTALGAKLISVRPGMRSNHAELVVEYQGTRTAFLVFKIGEVIVPLVDETGTSSAKFQAVASYRREQGAAIMKAQAEHGDSEGRSWGRWEARSGTNVVWVTYRPTTTNPAFKDQWGEYGAWSYRVADLAN